MKTQLHEFIRPTSLFSSEIAKEHFGTSANNVFTCIASSLNDGVNVFRDIETRGRIKLTLEVSPAGDGSSELWLKWKGKYNLSGLFQPLPGYPNHFTGQFNSFKEVGIKDKKPNPFFEFAHCGLIFIFNDEPQTATAFEVIVFPNSRREVQGRILQSLVEGGYEIPLCVLRGNMTAYAGLVESYLNILSKVWKEDFCLPPSADLFSIAA
jgi:hypothetical protein